MLMLNGKKALTPSRVASRLGYHTRTVQRWCRESIMWERLASSRGSAPAPPVKVRGVHRSGSGRYWIPREEFNRLVSIRLEDTL